ncbi:hypothetical protein GCM10012275_34510 [Longimycelium tulufanense]|uniref:Sulfite exporter TauE/SafE n=1 Tax=Longimycelium tulufanense TaxID=907463 RepID=A0A8J3CE05_9PSEU|nr:hypothetical protein GCM10012275_34510 [Longimycelium tulufanense]
MTGFLVGKLVSHALLGALLGTVGSVVQLSAGVRTWLQLLAGGLIMVFGLAQLGVPGFRNITVEPPLSWMRFVRNRSRSRATFAPTVLGVATVLLPCGVTLSVEALALASGSALVGVAIMAMFVLGTSPLFVVLGYAARKAAAAWRGRLSVLTGIVVLATGLYTFNGGLELAGSPLAASHIAHTVAGESPGDESVVSVVEGKQTVRITARTGYYSPENVQVSGGLPTTLVVHSEDARGCVRAFLVPEYNVEKILPVEGETRIDLGVLQSGTIAYSCGMGMYTGTITVA